MNLPLIESILLVKKFIKSSAVNEELLAGVLCVSLATVSNRNRGLFLLVLIKLDKYAVLEAESARLYFLKLSAQAW